MTRSKKYWNKLAASLSGELTSEQEQRFRTGMTNNRQMAADRDLVKNAWKKAGEMPVDKHADSIDAWNKLSHRIDQAAPQESQPVIPLTGRVPLLRIAAMALLVIAVGGSLTWYALDRFSAGNEVEYSASKGTRSIELPDGSTVYLNQGATMKRNRSFDRQRNVTLDGEGYFDVKPDPDNPFRVSARNVTITVLGTSFNVRQTTDNAIEVLVESGTVHLSMENPEQELTLHQGQFARADGALKTSTLDNENYLSWKTHRFKFVDEPAAGIFDVLEEAYHIKLDDSNIAGDSMRLTTTYNNESVENILETICTALNLYYEKEGKVYILHAK